MWSTSCQWHRESSTKTAQLSTCTKYLHQTAPKYFQELFVPVTASTWSPLFALCMQTAACGGLQVLTTIIRSFGPRNLAMCAPKLWNSSLPSLQDTTLTLNQVCSRLKTHLFAWFGLWAYTCDCLGCKSPHVIINVQYGLRYDIR